MPRFTVKNLPRLKLSDLLRRRKMTLDWFIKESGVQTYEALCARCHRLGVQPPPESDWKALRPKKVSSPSDGVVVLDPPDVTEESTGRRIDPEAPVTKPGVEVVTEKKQTTADEPKPDGGKDSKAATTAPKSPRRGRRKKKEDQPTE